MILRRYSQHRNIKLVVLAEQLTSPGISRDWTTLRFPGTNSSGGCTADYCTADFCPARHLKHYERAPRC